MNGLDLEALRRMAAADEDPAEACLDSAGCSCTGDEFHHCTCTRKTMNTALRGNEVALDNHLREQDAEEARYEAIGAAAARIESVQNLHELLDEAERDQLNELMRTAAERLLAAEALRNGD